MVPVFSIEDALLVKGEDFDLTKTETIRMQFSYKIFKSSEQELNQYVIDGNHVKSELI